jgi:hypothetical protein
MTWAVLDHGLVRDRRDRAMRHEVLLAIQLRAVAIPGFCLVQLLLASRRLRRRVRWHA